MAKASPKITLSEPPRYDWDSWTDGQEWELIEGEDYARGVNMISNCHSKASRIGKRCICEAISGGIKVRFYDPKKAG